MKNMTLDLPADETHALLASNTMMRRPNMAEGDVWICKLFSSTAYVIGTDIDRSLPGWQVIAEKRLPPPELLPLPVFADHPGDLFRNLPPVFTGGGGHKVCAALADIFRRFDLGPGGGVVPIQLYHFDRTTPGPSGYSILVVREKKQGLIPEASKGLYAGKNSPKPPTMWGRGDVKDDDIAVRATVRGGSDLWFDPGILDGFFMNDRVVQALKESGFAEYFDPIRCRIVEAH